MNLNKIPVLDNGYVALFSTSMDERQLRSLKATLYRNRGSQSFEDQIQVHLLIKSPVFVQLSLGSSSIGWLNSFDSTTEAYQPSVNEIRARDLETAELIQQDIKQTTEALLLNPKSYQMDTCDEFISQVITPVSVYNTYLATANLSSWINYTRRNDLPSPIEAYRKVIYDVLKAEWPSLGDLFVEKAKGKR